jgi:hypothetical protein
LVGSLGYEPRAAYSRASTATGIRHFREAFVPGGNAGRVPTFELYPAIRLTLRKNHGKTSVRVAGKCQLGTIHFVNRAINTLGLRFACVRLILGQRKYLSSCRTEGFAASAKFESKISVRALTCSAKNGTPKSS